VSGGALFILVVLILFLIWLAIARPTKRRRASHQAMIDNLQVGDEVITAGGFFVTVLEVAEDEVVVELSPGAQARLDKRAIGAVFPQSEDDPVVAEPTQEAPS
jgi:preprotein translocase subunit YajC